MMVDLYTCESEQNLIRIYTVNSAFFCFGGSTALEDFALFFCYAFVAWWFFLVVRWHFFYYGLVVG
jgi:hypothetical protein